MAYNKKTWLARLGQGLNKFSIDGATPVPIISQPDSVTQQGDALSAGNLNDLEQRIADAFDNVEESKADKSTTDTLQSQINQQEARLNQHEARIANLEQISGEYVPKDMQDYSSVPTGKATYALVETLKGVSRVENQLVSVSNTTKTCGGVSISVTDGVFTGSGTVTSAFEEGFGSAYDFVVGHKYLFVQPSTFKNLHWEVYPIMVDYDTGAVSGNIIATCTQAGSANIYLRALEANVEIKVDGFFRVTDLTLYFNGNIPSNADTVAHIAQYYPELLEPRAYNAGEIKNSTYTKVESIGKNRINPSDFVERSGYTGQWTLTQESDGIKFVGGSTNGRFVGFPVPLKIGETYVISGTVPTSGNVAYAQFDEKPTDTIGNSGTHTASLPVTFTASKPWAIIQLQFDYSGTYPMNVKLPIQVEIGSSATSYSPYGTLDTLPIPSVTLRSAGSVHDELDVETGVVTRKVGSVDLGTLNWDYDTGGLRFTSGIADIKSIASWNNSEWCVSRIYSKGIPQFNGSGGDLIIGIYNTGIFARNTAYTDPATFKTAMSGVILNYELETPTTESVTPTLNNTLKTEGGGTVFSDAEVDGAFTLGFLNL